MENECHKVLVLQSKCEDSQSSDDSEDWDDWYDEKNDTKGAVCLFCCKNYSSIDELWDHCECNHNFHIMETVQRLGLDTYGCIKLINYIRLQHPSPESITQVSEEIPWESENFLKPALLDDPLIGYIIDKEDEIMTIKQASKLQGLKEEQKRSEFLLERLIETENRVNTAEYSLTALHDELETIKSTIKATLLDSTDTNEESNVSDDDAYFNSYAAIKIHEDMLQDKIRTETYMRFMLNSPDLFQDKVVLDVGCGTGILSMFAAKAGCRHVYAIDQSDIINYARDIVIENELENKITLIKGKVEDVVLPVNQVDIIVSEWMGYCLLFESMLDTVIFARNKWLAISGHVFPNVCHMNMVAIDDKGIHDKTVGFWNNVYGFKMSCIRKIVMEDADVTVVKPETVISDVCCIKKIDTENITTEELNFQSHFLLKVNRTGVLTSIVTYFDVFFLDKQSFSTGPGAELTHWKQTVFCLREVIDVVEGDEIVGQFRCVKSQEYHRDLIIDIHIERIGNKDTPQIRQMFMLR